MDHGVDLIACGAVVNQSAHVVGIDNFSYGWKLTLGDDIIDIAVREHCPPLHILTLHR